MRIGDTEPTLGPNPKSILDRAEWCEMLHAQILSEDADLMQEVTDLYNEFPKSLLED
jgi:hypothetical protein